MLSASAISSLTTWPAGVGVLMGMRPGLAQDRDGIEWSVSPFPHAITPDASRRIHRTKVLVDALR
jgi:hypothetical protein